MDENHFDLIRDLIQNSDKRSEERHNDLVARLDMRFDHIDQKVEANRVSTDADIAALTATVATHTREIAAIEKNMTKEIALLKAENTSRNRWWTFVGAVVAAVAAFIGSWFSGGGIQH